MAAFPVPPVPFLFTRSNQAQWILEGAIRNEFDFDLGARILIGTRVLSYSDVWWEHTDWLINGDFDLPGFVSTLH